MSAFVSNPFNGSAEQLQQGYADMNSASENLFTGNLDWHRTQLQNQFNSAEAQRNRDWQTDMSNTAYQRAVADMKAAGLNPAMMFGSASAASTPSGSSAHNGNYSGSTSAYSGMLSGAIGSLMSGAFSLMANSANLDFKNKQLDMTNQYLHSSLHLQRELATRERKRYYYGSDGEVYGGYTDI